MTAKEKLRQVVDDLSEDEAVDVLELLSGSRVLDGEALTAILDGIPAPTSAHSWVLSRRARVRRHR